MSKQLCTLITGGSTAPALYPPITITYIPVVQRNIREGEKKDQISQLFLGNAIIWRRRVNFVTSLPSAQTKVGGGEDELDDAGAVV